MNSLLMTGLLIALALPRAAAGDRAEEDLKDYFEGRIVRLELDMPATDDGVDLYPERSKPIDTSRLAERLKEHGTALWVGQETMITKIKVKKKHIEFQLAGGGFGTFLDGIGPAVDVPDVPKSRREKALEKAVREETDPRAKRRLELDLAAERDAREAEERFLRAEAARAAEVRRIHIRQVALEGGSRFNIRFDRNVPEAALTPGAIMDALEPWVAFPWRSGIAEGPGPEPGDVSDLLADLHKGLPIGEVEAMMGGRPRTERRRYEGDLSIEEWRCGDAPEAMTLTFVEGILVRFGPAPAGEAATVDEPGRPGAETAFRRLR